MDQEGPLGEASKDHLVELHLQEGKGAGICPAPLGKNIFAFILLGFFFLGSEGMVFTESGIF